MAGCLLQGNKIESGGNIWEIAIADALYIGAYSRYELKLAGPKTYCLTVRIWETPEGHQENRILKAIARHLERTPGADAGEIWL